MPIHRLLAASITGLGLFVAGCGDGTRPARHVSEAHVEGSVRVVVTGRDARNDAPVWDLVPDLRIGNDTGPAAFDAPPWDIAVDSAGQISILLSRQQQIRVFDRTGRFVRTIGRPGSGPGEFRFPAKLLLDSAGRMWVSDDPRRVNVVFDSNGKLLREYPRPAGFQCRPTPCGRILSNGAHLDGRFRAIAPGILATELYLADSTGRLTDSLALHLRDGTPSEQAEPPRPFEKWLVFAPTSAPLVWTGFTTEYVLSALTLAGDTTMRITGFAEPVELTEKDRAAYRERRAQQTAAIGPPSADPVAFPRLRPPISQIGVAEDDALWVALSGPKDGVVEWFDVYNPDGTIRARARVRFDGSVTPQAAPAMNPSPILVTRNFVYMVELDDNDVPSVVRAKIKR